jgi:capsular exopolysaccharide synthesis family protein
MLDAHAPPPQAVPPPRRPAPLAADRSAPEAPFQPAIALAALRRRLLPFLLCLLAFPTLAGIAVSRLPARYTATGTVLYEPTDYTARELQSILRTDPAPDAVMASQAELARSLAAASALADTYRLDTRPEFNPALRPPGLLARTLAALRGIPPLAGLLGGPRTDGDVRPEAAREAVLRSVQWAIGVQVVRGSRVLEVSFTSHDPQFAAEAANFLMRRYIDDQLEAKFTAVRRAAEWLEGRVDSLRSEVRTAEDRIAAWRAAHGLMQGVQAGLETEQASRLALDLLQARADLAHAEGRLQAARGGNGAAAQAAIAPSVLPLRAQADQIAAQVQSTTARYGAAHPEAIALRDQLAAARAAVAAEVAREVEGIEADVAAARARVAALESDQRAMQARMERQAQAQIPLNAMQRDADAARNLLQAVLERVQQTTQQTAIEKPDARVISEALPPLGPSAPKPLLTVGIAAACGLLCGAMLVYLLEVGDSSLRSGEDVRRLFGLPCFALIPELTRRQRRGKHVAEYVARKPLSPFAEQLRTLRAALWLGGARPKVIAITAGRPGEGKTALAMALGRSIAMSGERVLVLDCDSREPALGRALHADAAVGLSEVLLGHATLEDVVRRDTLTSMSFIPAGTPQANALTLFLSEAMGALIAAARPHYDIVLLDAPPVLGPADARVLARLADATVLCVRWRHTPARVVRHALDMLEEAQAFACGIALTRVDPRSHGRAGYADSEIYHPRYGGYFVE